MAEAMQVALIVEALSKGFDKLGADIAKLGDVTGQLGNKAAEAEKAAGLLEKQLTANANAAIKLGAAF